QTQNLDNDFLPVFQGDTITPKKTDFALPFSPQHPTINQQYAALNIGEGINLSHMADDYTRRLAMLAGAEVKRDGEKESEAEAQLFTWLAAAIVSIRKLRSTLHTSEIPAAGPSETSTPQSQPFISQAQALLDEEQVLSDQLPLLGWTIVGHQWQLYIAYSVYDNPAGPIRIVGPLDEYFPGANTSSLLG
ncbi:MAG: hypothetical protein Q9164_007629, partial [Protoblastenia rupestris]